MTTANMKISKNKNSLSIEIQSETPFNSFVFHFDKEFNVIGSSMKQFHIFNHKNKIIGFTNQNNAVKTGFLVLHTTSRLELVYSQINNGYKTFFSKVSQETLTAEDVTYLASCVAGLPGYDISNIKVADVNQDGHITAADVVYLASHVAGVPGFKVPVV